MEASDYLGKRAEADLSISEVARLTGYSRSHISKVERGLVGPSNDYRVAFLSAVEGRATVKKPDFTVYPTQRAKKLASDSNALLQASLSHMDARIRSITKAQKSLTQLVDVIDKLTVGAPEYNMAGFDPAVASDSDLDAVFDHMVDVIVEMMVTHRFHTLDEHRIGELMGNITKHAMNAVKRERNKAILAGKF